MKSFKFIILGLILATVGFFSLFIFEMGKTPKLIDQKHDREHIIDEAKSAKKKLEKLRKDNAELKAADNYVKKMILADESSVLTAIKEISLLAEKDGFADPEFYYINTDSPATITQAGVAVDYDLARSMGLMKAKAVFVSIKFKSGFASLLNYLKDVYALKTVFSVEQISISRDEKIMPLQNISLLLALYMY
jgi:hypothetical protein